MNSTNDSTYGVSEINYDPKQFQALDSGYFLGEHRNYRLVTLLGQGAMGQAWLAVQVEGGEEIQKVVCKVLPDKIRNDEAAMAEVRRVFNLTKELNHQNICPMLGMFHDPSFGWFLVMAYADGGTLADWFANQPGHKNGLPLAKVLTILTPVADALDRAHAKKVIHRDVKPRNIMFKKDGADLEPWLIDFGIASRLHSADTLTTTHGKSSTGTPLYMAPEQFLSQPQSAATDQYALATIVYEFLSGHVPFDSENITTIGMLKAINPLPEIPNVSESVNFALKKALSVRQEDRFATCREFLETLVATSSPKSAITKLPVAQSGYSFLTVPTDVATLEEAYAKIAEGGKIQFLRGKYQVPKTITITKNVTILGDVQHPEYVILQGGENSVFHLESGFAEIAGLTIKNEGTGEYSEDGSNDAVWISTFLCTFHDCIFTSRSSSGFTVDAEDCMPNVQRCTARNCGGNGFYIGSGASGTFRECTAIGNVFPGIAVCDDGSNPTVEGCKFTDGKQGGILVGGGARGTFQDCTASGNAGCVMYVQDAGSNPMVERCQFADGKQNGIFVYDGASGTFRDCTASGNASCGMCVQGAGSNPTVEGCKFTDGKDVGILVCNSASGTFRDCTASGNAGCGMYVQGTGSNPTVEECQFTDSKDAGIAVLSGASGTFRNCTTSGNAKDGMKVKGVGSNPTVEECQFTDSKEAGIAVLSGASGTFHDCTASGNAYSEMQVKDAGSNPTVEGCQFTDGKSAGIFVYDGASGTFRNCTVSGNAACGMSVQGVGSNPTVERCTFTNNEQNGVWICDSAGGTFRNNELLGNRMPAWDVSWWNWITRRVVRKENMPNK